MPCGDKHCAVIFFGFCNALKTFKHSIPSTFEAEIFYFFFGSQYRANDKFFRVEKTNENLESSFSLKFVEKFAT